MTKANKKAFCEKPLGKSDYPRELIFNDNNPRDRAIMISIGLAWKKGYEQGKKDAYKKAWEDGAFTGEKDNFTDKGNLRFKETGDSETSIYEPDGAYDDEAQTRRTHIQGI